MAGDVQIEAIAGHETERGPIGTVAWMCRAMRAAGAAVGDVVEFEITGVGRE